MTNDDYERIYEAAVTLADGKRIELTDEDQKFLDIVSEAKKLLEEASSFDTYDVLPSFDFETIIEDFYSMKRAYGEDKFDE
jgi:hypothetical protein